jgi:hypothetical protein
MSGLTHLIHSDRSTKGDLSDDWQQMANVTGEESTRAMATNPGWLTDHADTAYKCLCPLHSVYISYFAWNHFMHCHLCPKERFLTLYASG